MKSVALAKVKDDLSGYLRRAEREEIVITRHGRPAGEKSREQLRRENGHFSFPNARISLRGSKPLE